MCNLDIQRYLCGWKSHLKNQEKLRESQLLITKHENLQKGRSSKLFKYWHKVIKQFVVSNRMFLLPKEVWGKNQGAFLKTNLELLKTWNFSCLFFNDWLHPPPFLSNEKKALGNNVLFEFSRLEAVQEITSPSSKSNLVKERLIQERDLSIFL